MWVTHKQEYNFKTFPVEIFVINFAHKTKNSKLTSFKHTIFYVLLTSLITQISLISKVLKFNLAFSHPHLLFRSRIILF